MKELDINGIKKHSFDVLCDIKRICEENGLRYSLSGGTLLGAVRHKGFIPWDDDIDIMMPRPDYEKFLEIAKNEVSCFDLYSYETHGDGYLYPFAKACRKNTKVVENGIVNSSVTLGVYVDIFPIDGAGNSLFQAKLRGAWFLVLHGLSVTSNWEKYRTSKLRKWYFEPLRYACYLISKLLGKKFINKSLNRFARAKSFEKVRFAARMVGDYGTKEILPKEVFDSFVTLSFEGEEFSAISDYDSFLSALYGDYMQLPPLQKQKTHHEFKAYWVD